MTKYICRFMPFREKGRTDAPLRCRVSWDSSRCIVSFNVGYRVSPERWDREAQQCLPGTYHGTRRTPAAVVNREVAEVRRRVDAVFAVLSEGGKVPTAEEFRAALNEAVQDLNPELAAVVHRFIVYGQTQKGWADGTADIYRVLRRNIQESSPALKLRDVSTSTLDLLVGAWLAKGLKHSTVRGYVGYLRSVLKWAKKRYNFPDEWEHYELALKVSSPAPVFLTPEELAAVQGLKLPEGMLKWVRDFFCFCCYTSLRYSDAHRLRWENVGRDSFVTTTKKTVKPVAIDLSPLSQAILDEYVDYGYKGGYVLPRVSVRNLNDHLPQICRMAGIIRPVTKTELRGGRRVEVTRPKCDWVTSHTGRHTFIANALSLGIPADIIMKWTGHKNYASLRPYVDILESAKANSMRMLAERLAGENNRPKKAERRGKSSGNRSGDL